MFLSITVYALSENESVQPVGYEKLCELSVTQNIAVIAHYENKLSSFTSFGINAGMVPGYLISENVLWFVLGGDYNFYPENNALRGFYFGPSVKLDIFHHVSGGYIFYRTGGNGGYRFIFENGITLNPGIRLNLLSNGGFYFDYDAYLGTGYAW